MRTGEFTQTATDAWAADATSPTDLERIGLITRLQCTVRVTPSATLSGAVQPDGLFRVIQNLVVKGGGHTYISLPADDGCEGGVLLHYLSQLDGFGYGHPAAGIVAPASTYTPITFPIHMGSRPQDQFGRDNPFDLTAFIPAGWESTLTAEWTTSGNDVLDDAVTISSGTAYYMISRVVGTDAEIRAEMRRQGVNIPEGANGMVPMWSALRHGNAGTTSDFDAETIDIPMGAWLKRIALLFQDATATRTLRASDEVTEVSINSPKTNEKLHQAHITPVLAKRLLGSGLTANVGNTQAVDEGGTATYTVGEGTDFDAHAPHGLWFFDARSHYFWQGSSGPSYVRDYGWDLRNMANGDLRLGLLISIYAAGDDTLALFERYQLYRGRIGS